MLYYSIIHVAKKSHIIDLLVVQENMERGAHIHYLHGKNKMALVTGSALPILLAGNMTISPVSMRN